MNLLHRERGLVKPMATDMDAVRRRLWVVGCALGLAMLGLLWRSYRIAVLMHDRYADQGNRQQLRRYQLKATRGDIVDRDHLALAVTDHVHKIVVNPRLIRARGLTDRVIAELLELFPGVEETYLRAELARDKAYRMLSMRLDDAQAKRIKQERLPGITLERIPNRVYPRKLLAAQVLGRVDGDGRGNLGIEYGLDAMLRGRDSASLGVFATGQRLLVEGVPDSEVSRGHTVVLTIDSAVQAMAEEEIDTLVANWRPQSASIIVLDPQNGELLAVSNRPSFDPNDRIERLEQTVNYGVQRDFEPGSTMKAITVAAAYEEGAIRKDETFFCENGRWQYTDEHSIRDTKHSGWLSVSDILAVSSNICTTKIYERLGKASLHRWVRRFRFGERPAIELPGAGTGVLADWERWSDIQGANIAFGQGMTASPLQVAAAFAVLANGGTYHAPRIVREVLDASGAPVVLERPEPQRIVRMDTARTVLGMLENVVHSKKGTGRNAEVDGYRVAGKTSTAQKAAKTGGYEEDKYFASFVGALPAKEPRVVILVSVDVPQGGHYGNEVAAPTFARLAARIMEHLSVPRDDGKQPGLDPIALVGRSDKLARGFRPLADVEPPLPGHRPAASTGGLPDFTGLTMVEAIDAAERANVAVRAMGSGVAVLQDTPPGPVEPGHTVVVYFEPPG
jgi:cell division protein FtsI (penicillin-binding protein 3)